MTINGFIFTSITCLLLPLPSLVVDNTKLEMLALYAALGLRGAAAVTVFTNAMMLVNTAAPAGQLGEVNGVGQAVGAFVRGFGPELIGLIWSWFLETRWNGAHARVYVISCPTVALQPDCRQVDTAESQVAGGFRVVLCRVPVRGVGGYRGDLPRRGLDLPISPV